MGNFGLLLPWVTVCPLMRGAPRPNKTQKNQLMFMKDILVCRVRSSCRSRSWPWHSCSPSSWGEGLGPAGSRAPGRCLPRARVAVTAAGLSQVPFGLRNLPAKCPLEVGQAQRPGLRVRFPRFHVSGGPLPSPGHVCPLPGPPGQLGWSLQGLVTARGCPANAIHAMPSRGLAHRGPHAGTGARC